jgi:peptide/nickel transport system substrate-binding protein
MKFSLERFIKNGGEPSFLLRDTIDKITATKEDEITIKLTRPFAAFPALLAYPWSLCSFTQILSNWRG